MKSRHENALEVIQQWVSETLEKMGLDPKKETSKVRELTEEYLKDWQEWDESGDWCTM